MHRCIWTAFYAVAFPLFSFSQDGWESIKKNDYRKAREEFVAVLKNDSINPSALKGMIYLSETCGDNLSYTKYLNTLINNHWDETTFMLFSDEYHGDADKVIKQHALSLRAKLDAQFSKADKDFFYRKFDESNKIYDKFLGRYQWTYIGPFKNVNGSGYETKFDVENELYNPGKLYKDEDGDEWKWVNPPYRDYSGPVAFRDFLLNKFSAVYFANLFFTVPSARIVQLRLTRNDPVKLWLDDNLIYSSNNTTLMEWDNEVVQLKLDAGTHRLLVKISSYNKESKNNLLYPDFEDFSADYDPGRSFERKSSSTHGDFQVRITDESGNLYSDIKTSPIGNFSRKEYAPEVKSFFVINELRSRIEKNSNDLFSYFALENAFEKYKLPREGEETFVKFARANASLVLAKYLAFRSYFNNNKKEKAYEIMSGIDQDRTPVFELLFQKLQEIDRNNDDDKYHAALDNIARISPSSTKIIKRYVEYYDKKGEIEKKENYVKETIKKYPEYKELFKKELKQSAKDRKKEKKENFKEEKRQSYSKDVRREKKDIKRYFYTNDYYDLADHYKSKDDNAAVMELYNEILRIQPYNCDTRYEKAKYLFEEEKYDDCISELKLALQVRSYKADYLELAGDAYYEKKDNASALDYFRLASKYSSHSSIDYKIEKIEGKKQYKKLFNTPSFREILDQPAWKEKYKDEESVVLLYTKDQALTSDKEIEIYQKFMVKILSDAGTKKWIEYDFGFMGNIKSIRIIKNNGAEVIPDGRGGYKVFKNLEAGDVIQIEGVNVYSLAANTIANEYYTRTYFNFEVPVYYEKYEVAVPEGNYFGYLHHRLDDNLQKSNAKGFDFYKWEYRDVPAVAVEEAPIDKMDCWASIMVSTMPDWSKLVTWYERKTYRKPEAGYEIKEIIDSIIRPGMSQREKVETIYNYLTSQIKYSYVTFLQSGYVPKDPDQTLCSRIGDCKDVATLMITMLREVGIESYYVLVKTNDYFHMKTLPSLYFNHAIAGYYLDGKLNFLDMTTDFYPYYILPSMDAGAWALLIKDGEKDLIQLPKDNLDSLKNRTEINIDAKLNVNRSADFSVKATYCGSLGGDIREYLTQSNKDEQKNYILKMLGKGLFENLSIDNYKFDNLREISKPLRSSYSLNAFNYCERVAGMLVFRIPYMTPVNTSPAMLTRERLTSLDVEEIVTVEPTLQKVKLLFPEGYELLEMPEDINIESRYGTYRVTFKRIKNGLYVEKFQSFSTSVVDVQEFNEFKKFYQQLLDIDSSKIALKKKQG